MSRCLVCGKELYTGKKYCSRECYSSTIKGRKQWPDGRKCPWVSERNRRYKGKSYDEMYGSKRAMEIKKSKDYGKGKTSEQRYGRVKAEYLRKNAGKMRNYDDIRGEKNPAKRKEVREKISRIKKETVEKWLPNVLKSLFKRPTYLEDRFISLCSEYSLPYRYCGDGDLIIGGKNPDFINVNDEKILLEVYSRGHLGYLKPIDYEYIRTKHFGEFGYKVIFLTWEDLQRKDWKEFCLKKLEG